MKSCVALALFIAATAVSAQEDASTSPPVQKADKKNQVVRVETRDELAKRGIRDGEICMEASEWFNGWRQEKDASWSSTLKFVPGYVCVPHRVLRERVLKGEF